MSCSTLLQRVATLGVSFFVLLLPSTSFAMDSFFDVFVEVSLPNPECQKCQIFQQEIQDLNQQLDELRASLDEISAEITLVEMQRDITRAQQSIAETQLEELRNPKDYVESDGTRYDSSDHTAMRMRSQRLWESYYNGDMNAAELEAEWQKPFDDPSVQRELERIKQELMKELEQQIENFEKIQEESTAKLEELNAQANQVSAKIDELLKALEEATANYEDCLQRCEEEQVSITSDYSLPEPQVGFFERFMHLIGMGDDEDDVIDFMPPPLRGEPLPGDVPLPEPMPVSPLPLLPPLPDSPVTPTAPCAACDPLLKDLLAKKAEIAALNAEKAMLEAQIAEVRAYYEQGQEYVEKAEAAVEEFRNPTNYAESDGRRFDSSDKAAMEVRNRRLWNRYQRGQLSAAELEAEWAKPFDDLSIQEELEEIKEDLDADLEQAVKDAKEGQEFIGNHLEVLEERLSAVLDKLVECAGQQAILQSLYDDCLQRCQQQPPVDQVFVPDFMNWPLPDPMQDMQSSSVDREDPEYHEQSNEDEADSEQMDEAEDELVEVDPETMEPIAMSTPKTGFLCNWFGIFCGDNQADEDDMDDMNINLADLVLCSETPNDPVCKPLDHNANGVFDDDDLADVDFSLRGPANLTFPLDISAFAGNDDLGINDISPFADCITNAIAAECDPLIVGNPSKDLILGAIENINDGLSGRDFQIGMANGSDILLGSPGDNFIDGDTNTFPGDGPFDGLDPLVPGPGDVFLGGNTLPGGWDTPPPPPVVPQDTTNAVPQAVKDMIAKIVRDNPLGPCEKLVIEVSRIRIGNKYKYTIVVRKEYDPSKCQPESCPPNTSYESIGTPDAASCSAACQNGNGGCVVIETLSDGRTCIMCGPPDFDKTDSGGIYVEPGQEFMGTNYGTPDGSNPTEGDSILVDPAPQDVQTTPGVDLNYECPSGEYKTQSMCESLLECDCVMSYESYCFACKPAICGDGVIDKGEECDDGNTISGDGCDESCQVEGPVCGNEVIETGEECDDGNMRAGDGCSKNCQLEKISCPDIAYNVELDCNLNCRSGFCKRLPGYSGCYYCPPTDVEEGEDEDDQDQPPLTCDAPTSDAEACKVNCNGECIKAYTRSDSVDCFECVERVEQPSCPNGSTGDKSICDAQCPSEGTCVGEDGCWSCVVVNCPDGTYKNSCPDSCANGCDVVGEQDGVQCLQCKQSCNDVCAQNGFGPEGTDYTDEILGDLQAYSCVSGANISIQTATIGSCNCVGEYSLSVDNTPPVCTGTPCGDVQCGSSATCDGGPSETVTVNCNWGGWEAIGKHQFRPIFGN